MKLLAVDTSSKSCSVAVSQKDAVLALQTAFSDRNALQCGYCTPGMLMTAQDLLKQETEPTRDRIREHLSGNYCRCTGYQAIIDAVESTARLRGKRTA